MMIAGAQWEISADTFKKLHEIVVNNCAGSYETLDDYIYYKISRAGGFRKGLVEVRYPLREEDGDEESGQGVVQFSTKFHASYLKGRKRTCESPRCLRACNFGWLPPNHYPS